MSAQPEDYERPADDEVIWVSRAEMKREAQHMFELAEQLMRLAETERFALALPAPVELGLIEAKRLTNANAQQRQLRHVAKLLQRLNHELLQARLAPLQPDSELAQTIQQQAELWRNRLLEEPSRLTEFLNTFPSTDHQPLRQSLMGSYREQQKRAADTPPGDKERRLRKQLLQYIRGLILQHTVV
jgi:ribosome-associated protein